MEGIHPSTSPCIPTFPRGNLRTSKMSSILFLGSSPAKTTKPQNPNSFSTLKSKQSSSQKSNEIKNMKIQNPNIMTYLVCGIFQINIFFVSAQFLSFTQVPLAQLKTKFKRKQFEGNLAGEINTSDTCNKSNTLTFFHI